MCCAANGVENAEVTIPLRVAGLNVPGDLTAKYPHLWGCTHLELDEQYWGRVSRRSKKVVCVGGRSGGVHVC